MWNSGSHQGINSGHHQQHFDSQSFTSTGLYSSPRRAPPVPLPSKQAIAPRTSKTSLRSLTSSVLGRNKPPSTISSNGDNESFISPQDLSLSPPPQKPLPLGPMHAAPLPVVSSRDMTEDEEDCPVCLEPLSFSFRLPGEKPHIVPECGHSLHEVSNPTTIS